MIDLTPGGKLGANRLQLRIIRRMDVRIETSLLDFSFPLVAPKIISRFQRQHDQPQDDRDAPEDRALPPKTDTRGKVRDGNKVGDPTQHPGGDEFYGHFLELPV